MGGEIRIRALSLRARPLLVVLLVVLVPACWSLAADETNQCAAGYGGGDDGFGGEGGGGFGGGDFGTGIGGGDFGTGVGGSDVGVASSSADVSGVGPSSGAGGGFSARPVPHRVRHRHRRGGLGEAVDAICSANGSQVGWPANAYINCKAMGLSPQACSFACGEVGAACASVAAHPFKLGQGTGKLTYCKNGGPTYTCTYTFPNTEACTVLVSPLGQRWLCLPPG